jgi:hypothetical protein
VAIKTLRFMRERIVEQWPPRSRVEARPARARRVSAGRRGARARLVGAVELVADKRGKRSFDPEGWRDGALRSVAQTTA